ncbi:hypothetical protein ABFX02_11G134400 [Erythranthe guttata]
MHRRRLTKMMSSKKMNSRCIEKMATANAVVIFSRSSCCLCHAVKRLFSGMGVSPTVHELDQHPKGKQLYRALSSLFTTTNCTTGGSASAAVPVVFIGGNLVGGIDAVLASHINGTLVPLLRQAGALWL